MQTNEPFPYVGVDFFEGYANDIRSRVDVDLIVYAPLTTDAAGWQPFSVANSDWIEESLTIFAELDPESDLSVGAPIEPNEGVIQMKGADRTFIPSISVDGTFLPLLHYSPPLTQLGLYQNFDLYSEQEVRDAAAAAVDAKGKSSRLKSRHRRKNLQSYFPPCFTETSFSPFTSLLSALDESSDDDKDWVLSLSVYPVHETLAQESVTGFLLMSVAWGRFFDNLLPSDVRNIRVFVNNTCGQSAAFDIVNGKVSV